MNYPTTDSTTGKQMPNPSFPIEDSYSSNNISFISDGGNEQVRPRGKMKGGFSFSYIALTSTQYKTIRDFYLARKGSYESFQWTHPVLKETYTVRFKMDTFSGKNFTQNIKTPLYSLDIKLEEVL